MKLNPKQVRFVQEYLVDLNATQSAIRSGYSTRTAKSQGARLLTDVDIQSAIQVGMKAREEKTGITQARVLQELAIVAFSDIKNYLDIDQDTGAIRAKSFDDVTMPENASRAVQSMTETRVIKEVKGTKDKPDTEMILTANATFKMHDKLKALELVGKHLGMFKEHIEHSGAIKTGDKLTIHVVHTKPGAGGGNGNGDGDNGGKKK